MTNESKRWVEVAVAELDKSIREKKVELAELERARAELLNLNGSNEKAKAQKPRKRLKRGLGKDLAKAAFSKYHTLSIPELREKILQDHKIELKDSSARRVIEQLLKEGRIREKPNGEYEHVLGEDDMKAGDPKKYQEEDTEPVPENDLPF